MSERSRLSRRDFIAAAGVGAGVLGVGLGSSRAVASSSGQSFDQEYDVVVVGSGGAGATAALIANREGASVAIVEKAPIFGGTTIKSGGVYWIPNNPLMREQGLSDPKEDALKYMVRCSYPTLYHPDLPRYGISQAQFDLIAAFYDNASPALEALHEMGALESVIWMGFDGQPFPDYYAHLPENKAPRGRGLVPKAMDPNRALNIGGGGMGFDLIGRLQAAVKERNIPVLLQHTVQTVFQNEQGEVVGVQAVNRGQTVNIRAKKAVIFGSGGFTQNPELRLNFLRGPVFGGCAVPSNQGDLVRIATEIGSPLGNMNNAWWAQVTLEEALANSSTPNDVFAVPGDSMILVNKYGQRVVDEKMDYNERTQVHFQWDPSRGEYKNLLLFMIYDQRSNDLFAGQGEGVEAMLGYPIPPKGSTAPYVIEGADLAELASKIDARLAEVAEKTGSFRLDESFGENLPKTVATFNEYAQAGADPEFHRGETPIGLAYHGPARQNDLKNPTMYPIADQGPYYAVILAGGTLDTKGGPRVNTKAQLVDVKGNPIPGIYGAGNCVASAAGQAYWAGGGTIGPAMVFGYVAALEAVKEAEKAV